MAFLQLPGRKKVGLVEPETWNSLPVPAGARKQGVEKQQAELGVTVAGAEEGACVAQLGGLLKATGLPELSTIGVLLD